MFNLILWIDIDFPCYVIGNLVEYFFVCSFNWAEPSRHCCLRECVCVCVDNAICQRTQTKYELNIIMVRTNAGAYQRNKPTVARFLTIHFVH